MKCNEVLVKRAKNGFIVEPYDMMYPGKKKSTICNDMDEVRAAVEEAFETEHEKPKDAFPLGEKSPADAFDED